MVVACGVLVVEVWIKRTNDSTRQTNKVQTLTGNVLTDLGPQGSALRGGYCYILEFGTLILIFLLIYGYDFILYHMITYLCSRS